MKLTVDIVGLKGVEDAFLRRTQTRKAGAAQSTGRRRRLVRGGGEEECAGPAQASPNRRPGELRDAIDMTVKLSGKQESGVARVGSAAEGKG